MRKTTVELPDELMREIRLRTALENRKLKDVMADLLRRGLESVSDAGPGRGGRIQFPLIVGTR
ncbi:MAG TPA: antitoxin, partial [Chloroflexota bacterium]|nr:antitoxin [Chloroflexota bacterium]